MAAKKKAAKAKEPIGVSGGSTLLLMRKTQKVYFDGGAYQTYRGGSYCDVPEDLAEKWQEYDPKAPDPAAWPLDKPLPEPEVAPELELEPREEVAPSLGSTTDADAIVYDGGDSDGEE